MNNSTVAICPVCKAFTKAANGRIINKKLRKEFFKLLDKGFIIKNETQEETKARKYSPYSVCIEHIKSQEDESTI